MARKRLLFNLSNSEKKQMQAIVSARTSEQRMVERCKIVLLTEEDRLLA